MSHPEDWEKFRHCVRLTRDIFSQKVFDDFRGPEIQPGENVETDEEIDAFCGSIWKAPITPVAPAAWATGTTRWPSSIPNAG